MVQKQIGGRTFKFICPQCGKQMFADDLAKGRMQGCPYCGTNVAIPRDASADCTNMPKDVEVRVSAEHESIRRLFMAAPWQIRICVAWMAIGGITTWPICPCDFDYHWWLPAIAIGMEIGLPPPMFFGYQWLLRAIGMGIGLSFSMFFAWMLLKWNWFRWTTIICGYIGNVVSILGAIYAVTVWNWGPNDFIGILMQSVASIAIISLLIARPCGAWYQYHYVGVMQSPPGRRRSVFVVIVCYIIATILVRLITGPLWFDIEDVNERKCPLIDASVQNLRNGPQIGTAYAFAGLDTTHGETGHLEALGPVEARQSYCRIHRRPGTLVHFSGCDVFLNTRRSRPRLLSGLPCVYVCCGTVEIYGSIYRVMREMDEKIARKRLSEKEEARRRAEEEENAVREQKEKEKRLNHVIETSKMISTRIANINRFLNRGVSDDFGCQEAIRVNPTADTKTEVIPHNNHLLSTSSKLEEIETEQLRLDRELERLDVKLRVLEECYKVHSRQRVERAAIEEKRRIEKAVAEEKRRAEEEAKELESRKVKCSLCSGTGVIDCTRCKGSGTIVVYDHEMCPLCGNGERKGYVKKQVKCDHCRGTGRITQRCGTCRGKGRVWVSHGTARFDTKEQCSNCGGSGRGYPQSCQNCLGSGEVGVWQTCGRCRGSGEVSRGNGEPCSNCNGKGKFKCVRCDGRGFTYRPKTDGQNVIPMKGGDSSNKDETDNQTSGQKSDLGQKSVSSGVKEVNQGKSILQQKTNNDRKELDKSLKHASVSESPEYIPLNEPYKPTAEEQAAIDEAKATSRELMKKRDDHHKNLNSSTSRRRRRRHSIEEASEVAAPMEGATENTPSGRLP